MSKALSTANYGMDRGIVLAERNVQVGGGIDYLPVYMMSQLQYDEY